MVGRVCGVGGEGGSPVGATNGKFRLRDDKIEHSVCVRASVRACVCGVSAFGICASWFLLTVLTFQAHRL